ncbi:hypothetical protein ACI2K4_18630 [Micromonospora sp. NPDC050397]|uniref:hypothetical protein n=1 Tax=Micromonospora sp. NPDC050397 TaxID=3364279 RepID=UPI00384FC248
MRKFSTFAGVAGVGVVLALVASTPSMAHNVHGKGPRVEVAQRDGGADAGSPPADHTLVTFKGGIGVQPVSAGNGQDLVADTVNRNVVRGVQPAAQPWRIGALEAKVNADGRIKVHAKGLVFAGGDTVGTALMIGPTGEAVGFNVFATLICENLAPFVDRNTGAVPLSEDGEFVIDDVLSPPPPDSCATPVLLIRNEGNQAWFAAGIRQFDDDSPR